MALTLRNQMIQSVSIKRFRGIVEGQLEGLFPLTVLLGPNNSGKSTCLEALALAYGDLPPTAEIVFKNRGWLGLPSVRSAIPKEGASIEATLVGSSPEPRLFRIELAWHISTIEAEKASRQKGIEPPSMLLEVKENRAGWTRGTNLHIDQNGGMAGSIASAAAGTPPDRRWTFLDANVAPDNIEQSMVTVDSAGEAAHRALVERLKVLDPDLQEIRAIPIGGKWIPHAMYARRSIPLAVTGDGMKRLFHIASHLAVIGDGLALIEEPECFQHARSLDELVRVLWKSVDEGAQIIMSTHSLELVDLLCLAAKERGLDRFGIFRLALKDSNLRAVRVPGADALILREEMLEDLRR